MKRIALLALAVVIVAASTLSAAAQSVDLTGKWLATFVRTAPNGQTQAITFDFYLVQKGKELTGTVGPTADRQWKIEKGVVNGTDVTFEAQQIDGPLRSFKLTLEKDHLKGTQTLAFQGQAAETTVDAVRVK